MHFVGPVSSNVIVWIYIKYICNIYIYMCTVYHILTYRCCMPLKGFVVTWKPFLMTFSPNKRLVTLDLFCQLFFSLLTIYVIDTVLLMEYQDDNTTIHQQNHSKPWTNALHKSQRKHQRRKKLNDAMILVWFRLNSCGHFHTDDFHYFGDTVFLWCWCEWLMS